MKSTTVKILALLLVVCALFGVAACSNFGAEEATTEPRSDSATPLDKLMVVEDGKANVDYKATIKYFNDLMVKLNSDDVKAKINYSCEYDFNSFDSGNAELDAALRTLGKLIKDGFNSQYATEDDKLEYGDNFAEIVPIKGSDKPLVLKESDIAVYQLKEGEERLYDDGHTLIFINEAMVFAVCEIEYWFRTPIKMPPNKYLYRVKYRF